MLVWFRQLLARWLPGGAPRAKSNVRSTVSARVIRADGTVEELGVISRNGRPVRRR